MYIYVYAYVYIYIGIYIYVHIILRVWNDPEFDPSESPASGLMRSALLRGPGQVLSTLVSTLNLDILMIIASLLISSIVITPGPP